MQSTSSELTLWLNGSITQKQCFPYNNVFVQLETDQITLTHFRPWVYISYNGISRQFLSVPILICYSDFFYSCSSYSLALPFFLLQPIVLINCFLMNTNCHFLETLQIRHLEFMHVEMHRRYNRNVSLILILAYFLKNLPVLDCVLRTFFFSTEIPVWIKTLKDYCFFLIQERFY